MDVNLSGISDELTGTAVSDQKLELDRINVTVK